MRIFTPLAVVSIALATPIHAAAQEQTQAVVSPDQMQLARDVVEIGFPPESRMQMFDGVIEQVLGQIAASLPDIQNDPQRAALFERHVQRVRATSLDVLADHIDPIMESMVQAYAEEFTAEELQALHTFVTSPEGRGFLMRMTELANHPAVASANQAYMQDYLAHMPAMMEALRQDMETARTTKE